MNYSKVIKEGRMGNMEKLSKHIDVICKQKYEELKTQSKTYGELKRKLENFKSSIVWNKDFKENGDIYLLISNRLFEMFNQDVSNEVIKK